MKSRLARRAIIAETKVFHPINYHQRSLPHVKDKLSRQTSQARSYSTCCHQKTPSQASFIANGGRARTAPTIENRSARPIADRQRILWLRRAIRHIVITRAHGIHLAWVTRARTDQLAVPSVKDGPTTGLVSLSGLLACNAAVVGRGEVDPGYGRVFKVAREDALTAIRAAHKIRSGAGCVDGRAGNYA